MYVCIYIHICIHTGTLAQEWTCGSRSILFSNYIHSHVLCSCVSLPLLLNSRILQGLPHLQQHSLLKETLMRILATHLQNFVQMLINPVRIISWISLPLRIKNHMDDLVMLRHINLQWSQQSDMNQVSAQHFLAITYLMPKI